VYGQYRYLGYNAEIDRLESENLAFQSQLAQLGEEDEDLKKRIDDIEHQVNILQIDMNEFHWEILYYVSRGVMPIMYYVEFNGTIGIPLEGYLLRPEMHPYLNITVIRVSKYRLREEFFGYLYEHLGLRSHQIFANIKTETLYVLIYKEPYETPKDLHILWWSPWEEQ